MTIIEISMKDILTAKIGARLLLLLEFMEWNVKEIIQVVKKHDKLLAQWEGSHGGGGAQDGDDGGNGLDDNDGSPRYVRLRQEYLPRFAMYSSDPKICCLYTAVTDARNDCPLGAQGGGRGGEGSGKPGVGRKVSSSSSS